MEQTFSLYFSGTHLGDFRMEDGAAWARLLEPETARIEDWRPLSPAQRQELLALTKLDLPAVLELAQSWTDGGPSEAQYTQGPDGWLLERGRKFPRNLLLEEGRVVAVQCPQREAVTVLVEPGFETRTSLALWRRYRPTETLRPVERLLGCRVPMGDGVTLAADVMLPGDRREGETFPTVLVRTPYGKEGNRRQYDRYVQRGYAVVVQDVRGRNESEGEWQPFYYEVEDGDDTLSWIAAQPWSDGKVGMVGGSYLGYVQWAAAASGNPHLKAMVSVVTAGSAFADLTRRGGTFSTGSFAWSFAVSEPVFHPEWMERDDWDEVLAIRPLRDIPRKALGRPIPFLDRYLEHPDEDDFWRRSDWKKRYQNGPVPALIQSGWFDDNGMGTTEALDLVRDWPAGSWKAVLGPWQHSGNSCYDLHGLSFGPHALRFDLDLLYLQWLDRHLKGVDNGVDRGAAVEYYTLGSETWRTATAWPPAEGTPLTLYLDSAGDAQTSAGDGRLTDTLPKRECSDLYRYDPGDPATHLIDLSENEMEAPADYAQQELRPDYLCYTGPALTQPLTITGDATVHLHIAADAPDTDFIVRVCDVYPDGRSMKLADGVLTAKYRAGFDRPKWLTAGDVYELTLRTTKFSNTFLPGHRLRVTVTSSAQNFFVPHTNTREGYDGIAYRVAHVAVHHGGEHPARIELRQDPAL